MSANVIGTVHALEAARAAGVRKFVYAASSSCYGIATELPTTERAPIRPEYPYALSKYQGEQAVLHWGQVYKLPVMSIRIFNAYGPRSKTTGAYGAVFGVFLAQKLNRQAVHRRRRRHAASRLRVRDRPGSRLSGSGRIGSARRRFTTSAAGNPQPVNRLVELLGGDVVHVPKRPGEPDCTWADISKIRRELGWEPRVTFEEGVAEMLRNIDYWREAPVWDPASIEQATRTWFAMLSRGAE